MRGLRVDSKGLQGSFGGKLRHLRVFVALAQAVLLSGCSSWNVAVPPNPHQVGIRLSNRKVPDYLESVITLGPPPKTADDSYRIMIARCQASEREKRRSLITYRAAKWTLLPLGLASSSASVALTAINDPSATGWSESARTQMRVWSVISGSVGVLLGTVYGLVGFDTRIDATTKDLVAMRIAMDRARSQWAPASGEERRALLWDMARRCNSEELIGQITSDPSHATAVVKKHQEVMDNIAEADGILKDIEENVLKMPFLEPDEKAAFRKTLAARTKDLRAVLVELAQDFLAIDPEDLKLSQDLLAQIRQIDTFSTESDPGKFRTAFLTFWGDKGKAIKDLLASAKKSIESKEQAAAKPGKNQSSSVGTVRANQASVPTDSSKVP